MVHLFPIISIYSMTMMSHMVMWYRADNRAAISAGEAI